MHPRHTMGLPEQEPRTKLELPTNSHRVVICLPDISQIVRRTAVCVGNGSETVNSGGPETLPQKLVSVTLTLHRTVPDVAAS